MQRTAAKNPQNSNCSNLNAANWPTPLGCNIPPIYGRGGLFGCPGLVFFGRFRSFQLTGCFNFPWSRVAHNFPIILAIYDIRIIPILKTDILCVCLWSLSFWSKLIFALLSENEHKFTTRWHDGMKNYSRENWIASVPDQHPRYSTFLTNLYSHHTLRVIVVKYPLVVCNCLQMVEILPSINHVIISKSMLFYRSKQPIWVFNFFKEQSSKKCENHQRTSIERESTGKTAHSILLITMMFLIFMLLLTVNYCNF